MTGFKCSNLNLTSCGALQAPQHAPLCLLESFLPHVPKIRPETCTALIRPASVHRQSSVTLRYLHMALAQLLTLTCACAGQWANQSRPVVAPDHASIPACKSPTPGVQQLLPELSGPCRGDVERAPAFPHSLHSLCSGRLSRQLSVQSSAFRGSLRCAMQGVPSCSSPMWAPLVRRLKEYHPASDRPGTASEHCLCPCLQPCVQRGSSVGASGAQAQGVVSCISHARPWS